MNPLIEELKQCWLSWSTDINEGASELQLKQFESQYQVVLPADFRDYLAAINGFTDYSFDDNLISFWSIERIHSVREEYSTSVDVAAERLFIFADYSISCHEYAILLSSEAGSPTPIYLYCNSAPVNFNQSLLIKIATSFTEFVDRYLNSEKNLLFPEC